MKLLMGIIFLACLGTSAYACDRMAVLCPGGNRICPRNNVTCEWRCDLCGRAKMESSEMLAEAAPAGKENRMQSLYIGPTGGTPARAWACSAINPRGFAVWARHKEKVLAVKAALERCVGDCSIGQCFPVN